MQTSLHFVDGLPLVAYFSASPDPRCFACVPRFRVKGFLRKLLTQEPPRSELKAYL